MRYIGCYFLLIFVPFFSYTAEIVKDEEQVLRISVLDGLAKSSHPHLVRDSESTTLTKAVSEGLTRINLDGKVELALARKIEISKCKTKYTIYLRRSKWSNGEDLTALHFVDSWKLAITPDSKYANPLHFFVIKNAEKVFKKELPMEEVGIYAPSKNKIIIHLEHPSPYFTQILAATFFSPLFDTTKTNVSVFNGPFLIEKLNLGKNLYLKKNPLYWDVSNVKLDRIEISQISDAMTTYELYQKGKLDFIGSPFSDLTEEILQHAKGLKSAPAYASYLMYINTKNPKLYSKKIRKALGLSIDRNYISNGILANAIPSASILPEGISFVSNKHSLISKDQIQNLFVEGLKEIGCSLDDFSLTVSYTATPRHANLAKYLKHQWEKTFNIKVNLDKSDWGTFYSKLNSRNYEIGGFAFYPSYADPIYILEGFYKEKTNRSQWESLEFKKWIDLAKHTVSEKKREEYIAKAEEILMEESPVISIYTHKHLYLCNPNLKGFRPSKIIYQDFKWAYFQKE